MNKIIWLLALATLVLSFKIARLGKDIIEIQTSMDYAETPWHEMEE